MRVLRGPDPQRAARKFERLIPFYRRPRPERTQALTRRAVSSLQLKRGDRVIDVGCGAGGAFSLLEQEIGPEGEIIGVDVTAAMLEVARERCEREGWGNVTLIESPLSEIRIPVAADAAIAIFAMEAISSQAAIENLVRHLKPGARVAAIGTHWGPVWRPDLNLKHLRAAVRFGTSLRRRRRPWKPLAGKCAEFELELLDDGRTYLATGRLPLDGCPG